MTETDVELWKKGPGVIICIGFESWFSHYLGDGRRCRSIMSSAFSRKCHSDNSCPRLRSWTVSQKAGTHHHWSDHLSWLTGDFRIQALREADPLYFSSEKSSDCLTRWFAFPAGSRKKIRQPYHRRLRDSHEKTYLCDTKLHILTYKHRHIAAHGNWVCEAYFWSHKISLDSFRFQTYFFQTTDDDWTHRPRTMTFIRPFSWSGNWNPIISPEKRSEYPRAYSVAYYVRDQGVGESGSTREVYANIRFFVFQTLSDYLIIMLMMEIGYIQYNKSNICRARYNRANQTKAERLIRWIIRKKQLWYIFLRQKMIDSFILDFYCSKLMLWVEIDWESHKYNQDYDNQRDEKLRHIWIKIIR